MPTIHKNEVAKYYIQCELDNIVDGEHIQLREGLYNTNVPRLLEALSFTFRANSVFDYIESNQYRWEKREVPVNSILLTRMSGRLNELIYSDQIQQDPYKFVEYIHNNPRDGLLAQFKQKDIPDDRKIIMLRESNKKLVILDGSHRFLTMVMNGQTEVTCYVAIHANNDAKPMVGDATFLRLRKFWQDADDLSFKSAIEKTVAGMMASSINGHSSVKAYWVDMAPNEEVRTAGKRLLQESSTPD